jgi:hypothetical protein
MSSKTYPKIGEVLFFVLKIFLFKLVTFETDRKLAFRLRFSLEIIFFSSDVIQKLLSDCVCSLEGLIFTRASDI